MMIYNFFVKHTLLCILGAQLFMYLINPNQTGGLKQPTLPPPPPSIFRFITF